MMQLERMLLQLQQQRGLQRLPSCSFCSAELVGFRFVLRLVRQERHWNVFDDCRMIHERRAAMVHVCRYCLQLIVHERDAITK